MGWGRGLFSTQWSRRPSREVTLEQQLHSVEEAATQSCRGRRLFAADSPLQGQRSPETAWHFQGAEKRLMWLARGSLMEQEEVSFWCFRRHFPRESQEGGASPGPPSSSCLRTPALRGQHWPRLPVCESWGYESSSRPFAVPASSLMPASLLSVSSVLLAAHTPRHLGLSHE